MYKSKTILKIFLIILIVLFVFILIKKYIPPKTVETSNSNNSNTYKVLVDVEDSKLFLFENDKLIKVYKCSGGKWSTPSPIGTWTVISKAKWGEGFRTEVGWD